jgi:hypothetical protein
MLKAHSRLLEHLALAVDLGLIGACWLAAYGLRFYVVGPPLVTPDVAPFTGYLLQLLPILVVWGVAFHWFGLYRPRRLGSRLGEWVDVAKASTLGVLVLVTIMNFVFHAREYSRVAISYFWALSIIVLSLWRAAFREGLRIARRHGLNQRLALVVGGAEPADGIVAALKRRPDVGVQIIGVVGDKADNWTAARRPRREDARVLSAREVEAYTVVARGEGPLRSHDPGGGAAPGLRGSIVVGRGRGENLDDQGGRALDSAPRDPAGIGHDDEVGLHRVCGIRITSIGALNTSPRKRPLEIDADLALEPLGDALMEGIRRSCFLRR